MFLYKKFVWYPSSSFPDGTGHLPALKRLTFKFQEQIIVSWSKYWKKEIVNSAWALMKSQSNSYLQAQSWAKRVQSKLKKTNMFCKSQKARPLVFRITPVLLCWFSSQILILGPEALWPMLAMVSMLAPTWRMHRDIKNYIYSYL